MIWMRLSDPMFEEKVTSRHLGLDAAPQQQYVWYLKLQTNKKFLPSYQFRDNELDDPKMT